MTAALVLFLVLMGSPALAATLYASPSGGGSSPCTNSGSPCTRALALSLIQCGDTLILKDGTYTGSGGNPLGVLPIDVGTAPSAQSCSGNRVTVQAETDGGVLLDGEHTRYALYVFEMSGWTFIGMNARYGFTSSGGVIYIFHNSSHITLQRVVVWDAGDANDQVLIVDSSDTILFEDVGAFGLGNQTCVDFLSTNVTYRRVFCRAEGGRNGNNWTTNQFNYYGNTINPSPAIVENVIQTNAPGNRGLFTQGWITDFNRDDAENPGVRYYGGIHYAMNTSLATNQIARGYQGSFPIGTCTGYVIKDTVIHAGGSGIQPLHFNVGDGEGCGGGVAGLYPGRVQEITRLTTVGDVASSLGNATVTNHVTGTSIGLTGFNYMGGSNTAQLCFRYVDGVYTSTPLWPWPMDDRIKAAIASNTTGAGAVGGDSPALAGTAGTGYAANTVTSEIVSLLGSIPTACNSAAAFTPNFPVASDFPAVSVIDNFDRSDSGTLGANWTNLNIGGTFSVVSNQAAAPAGFDRAYYTASQFTASHEVAAIWTTATACCGANAMLSFAGTDIASANSQYRLLVNRQSGSNATMEIRKIDSVGGSTVIISPVDLGADVANNDGFGVRVSGTTISMYWKYHGDGVWYRTGEATDATLPSSNVYGGLAGFTPATINDFYGGPTPSEPPISPPNPFSPSTGAGRFGTTFPGVR